MTTSAPVSATGRLLPHHLDALKASAISEEVIQARGYWSATRPDDLRALGFNHEQSRLVPALVVPAYDIHGQVHWQMRPDRPRRSKDGEVIRYETPCGGDFCIDVHPHSRERVKDPSIPLVLTEGVKKNDAGTSSGLCVVDFAGVWQFRVAKKKDPTQPPLPDWDAIPLSGRSCYICYDSDAITKHGVRAAVRALKRFLKSRGASVLILVLPQGEDGEKVGLDNFLAQGHTAEDVLALAQKELPPLPSDPAGCLTEAMRARLSGLADVRPDRLMITTEATDDERREIALRLKSLYYETEEVFSWWLGDFYLQLSAPYGTKTALSEQLLGSGLAMKAQKAASINKKFPAERRREGLSRWVYEEVLGAPYELQEAVLDTVESEPGTTRAQVRAMLQKEVTLSDRSTGSEPSRVSVLHDFQNLQEVLPVDKARRLYAILKTFGDEELDDWMEAQEARMTDRDAPGAEPRRRRWDGRDANGEDDSIHWTLTVDELDAENASNLKTSRPFSRVNLSPAEDLAERLEAEDTSSMGESSFSPPPAINNTGGRFAEEAGESPPVANSRPYHELTLLAEAGALPAAPLKQGEKFILNVPNFRDHVLTAARQYQKEQSHYWITELSNAQKAWTRFCRQARDSLPEEMCGALP
jgi:hypothetical protein